MKVYSRHRRSADIHDLGAAPTFAQYMDACKEHYLRALLVAVDGDIALAAKMAGRSRTDMYKLLHSFDLIRSSSQGRHVVVKVDAFSVPMEGLVPLMAKWPRGS